MEKHVKTILHFDNFAKKVQAEKARTENSKKVNRNNANAAFESEMETRANIARQNNPGMA